jgi:exopolysaccharide biosynthesis operon protein EpsL
MKHILSLVIAMFTLLIAQTTDVRAAEDGGVQLSAGIEIAHDDNLFRLPGNVEPLEGLQRSERILRLNAGFGATARLGLQTVTVDLAANQNKFANNSFLDFTGNNASARWNWQVGSNLSGAAAYTTSRVLAEFGERRRETQDLLTTRGPSLSANLKIALDHTVGLEASRLQARRSDLEQKTLENDTSNLGISWTYRSSLDNQLGIRVRNAEAKYLNQNLLPAGSLTNNFEQREFSGFASGPVGAVTRWTAELGYAKREYPGSTERDFSGAVARAGLDWKPTAKLGLGLGFDRQLVAPEDLGIAYSVSSRGSITATWEVTQAIGIRALAERDRRNYRSDATTSPDGRQDTLQRVRLSADFAPAAFIKLTASLESGRRESTLAAQNYSYNQASIGAEARF